MQTFHVVAIVGSLRTHSFNAATARAAVELAPEGVEITIHPIDDVPLYNGDVEDAGLPASVVALHDVVDAADGVVFFTPEYNSSFPAVTKNVIDWLSRPPRPIQTTAVTAVATTPGGRAGAGVLHHFSTSVVRMVDEGLLFEPLGIGSYRDKFVDLELVDPDTRTELAEFLEGFARSSRSHHANVDRV